MAGYREFTSAFLDYSRAQDALDKAMAGGMRWAADRDDTTTSRSAEETGSWDEAWRTFVQAVEVAKQTGQRLGDSLAYLELVASEPVANAATAVFGATQHATQARSDRFLSTSASDLPMAETADREASKAVLSAQEVLRDAVRAELQLDA
jgi:hypothetical protein